MVKVKVRGVIKSQNNKIMFCTNNSFYCLPGGTLESGETIHECLIREFTEELGIKPVIGSLLYVDEFCRGSDTTIDLRYEIKNISDYTDISHQQLPKNSELTNLIFICKDESKDYDIRPDYIFTILDKIHTTNDLFY